MVYVLFRSNHKSTIALLVWAILALAMVYDVVILRSLCSWYVLYKFISVG